MFLSNFSNIDSATIFTQRFFTGRLTPWRIIDMWPRPLLAPPPSGLHAAAVSEPVASVLLLKTVLMTLWNGSWMCVRKQPIPLCVCVCACVCVRVRVCVCVWLHSCKRKSATFIFFWSGLQVTACSTWMTSSLLSDPNLFVETRF